MAAVPTTITNPTPSSSVAARASARCRPPVSPVASRWVMLARSDVAMPWNTYTGARTSMVAAKTMPASLPAP